MQTEQGKPIYGATVIVQNTTLGTTTDADGKFSIKLDAGTQPVLQISFIGYETNKVTVDNPKTVTKPRQSLPPAKRRWR